MPSKVEAALDAKRGKGFWLAGGVALLLSCVSYVNQAVVAAFNVHLFHAAALDPAGWWLYLAIRLPIAALFVWTVVRFPRQQERAGQLNQKTSGTRFYDPLMGLRVLACVLVLVGHYFVTTFPFAGEQRLGVRVLVMAPPWCGVWLFFTLSGYLMGKGFASGRYTLDEPGCRQFLRNRLLRIGPIYVCSLLLVSLYRYPQIFEWRHGWMLIEMLIFDYRGDLPINPIGALWSVGTEVQFYILVPMLMVLMLRARKWAGRAFVVAPLVLVVAGDLLRVWITHQPSVNEYSYAYSPLLPNLDVFLAGMSMNLMPAVKVPFAVQRRLGLVLLALAVVFYLGISFVSMERGVLHLNNFLAKAPVLCVLFAVTFIYVAELRGRIRIGKGLLGACLIGVQTVGMLTYCLYVFHPEVYLVNAERLQAVHPLGVSLAYLPLVMLELFAIASFFYFAVEKPFDMKKRVSGTVIEDAP